MKPNIPRLLELAPHENALFSSASEDCSVPKIVDFWIKKSHCPPPNNILIHRRFLTASIGRP
jgi:hypothetical protein